MGAKAILKFSSSTPISEMKAQKKPQDMDNNPKQGQAEVNLKDIEVEILRSISPRKQSLTYKQCGFDGLSV